MSCPGSASVHPPQSYHGVVMLRPILIVLALTASGLASGESLEPPERIARLSYVQGEMSFQGAQEVAPSALPDRPLDRGDRLSTARDGRAEIALGGATLRLDEDTALTIADLDASTVRLQLDVRHRERAPARPAGRRDLRGRHAEHDGRLPRAGRVSSRHHAERRDRARRCAPATRKSRRPAARCASPTGSACGSRAAPKSQPSSRRARRTTSTNGSWTAKCSSPSRRRRAASRRTSTTTRRSTSTANGATTRATGRSGCRRTPTAATTRSPTATGSAAASAIRGTTRCRGVRTRSTTGTGPTSKTGIAGPGWRSGETCGSGGAHGPHQLDRALRRAAGGSRDTRSCRPPERGRGSSAGPKRQWTNWSAAVPAHRRADSAAPSMPIGGRCCSVLSISSSRRETLRRRKRAPRHRERSGITGQLDAGNPAGAACDYQQLQQLQQFGRVTRERRLRTRPRARSRGRRIPDRAFGP